MDSLTIACTVRGEYLKKLEALFQFQGMAPLRDIAAICLETGIDLMWEQYRNNPKHAKQIEEYEKEQEV